MASWVASNETGFVDESLGMLPSPDTGPAVQEKEYAW
jgi:hypothetical protein